MELRKYALAFALFLFARIDCINVMNVASSHKVLSTSENKMEKSCKSAEYLHEHLCCQKCPAGKHVLRDCHTYGGESICAPCHSGKSFTRYDNGLQSCLTCRRCRRDEETVHNCTSTSDTVCQCKSGKFCSSPDSCEYCEKCTKRCPEGQVIVQHCNATSDIVCGKDPAQNGGAFQGTTAAITSRMDLATTRSGNEKYLWLLIIPISLSILGAYLWYQRRRRKKTSFGHINHLEENESTEVSVQSLGTPLLTETPQAVLTVKERTPSIANARSSMPRTPDVPPITKPSSATECTIHLAANNVEESSRNVENQEEPVNTTVLQSPNEKPHPTGHYLNADMYADIGISQKDATTIFKTFINEVPLKEWKMFMRTMRLNDYDIDVAIDDNPNNVNEQCYAMFVKWKNKSGNEATINKLLMGLCEMKLKACCENIENELIRNGILNRHNNKMREDMHLENDVTTIVI